jgi:acetolactate synthase-1/2/3 large subunit
MNGAQAMVDSVLDHGVDTIFGLPGGQLYYLYDALYRQRDRVQVITSRHEQGAAYMAFGYAHSTGRVGVYDVVPGPGLLNTTAALCTAYGANARVLCLTGQVPTVGIGSGAGYLHELPDQLGLMRKLTKWAERIERPEDAPALVAEAFRQLQTGRPRPVELEMAPDIMEMQADVELLERVDAYPLAEPDPDRIAQAAELLGHARRPLIMIGGGAVDAGAELLELADMLQAPVVSHRQGKGDLSGRPPALGRRRCRARGRHAAEVSANVLGPKRSQDRAHRHRSGRDCTRGGTGGRARCGRARVTDRADRCGPCPEHPQGFPAR